MHDDKAERAILASVHMHVPWYLIASYGYYHLDISLLSDTLFDQICVTLNRCWDEIKHSHKHIINRDDLTAGSCFLPVEVFPLITRSTTHMLAGQSKFLGICLPLAPNQTVAPNQTANTQQQQMSFFF